MIEDEKFFAWLDGELGAAEAAAVEREVAADPRLSALADEHRAMQAQLKGAFNQVADAPVPEKLSSALRAEPAEVVDFTAARQRKKGPRPRALPQWMAMAAMLAIGIFVGTLLQVRGGAPIEVQKGRIYAAGGLADALDTQLASAPANVSVRIGLTFRDRTGAICRSFADPQASGLACREGGDWQVHGLFAAPEGQSSDYRMAAGMDPNLAALVDSTMAGEPFDAAQEKAARAKGWR
jgi:hypothetical protein